MLKALILDFDGIILESVDTKGWGFRKLFEAYPQHLERIIEYHYANGGMPRFDKFRYIYREILKEPLSEEKFRELCDRYSRLVFERVLACDFVAGAKEFLDAYHKVYSLFIVSGTPHEEIVRVVEARGLQKYFRGVYGSPEAKGHWTKKILTDNRLKPAETLWVGDALSDLKAADDSGIRFIGRFVAEHDIFRDKKVFLTINDLRDLNRFLKDEANKKESK